MAKIYISGPITGTDDFMERFSKAEKKLSDGGWDAVNPAACNSRFPAGTSWERYMGESLKLLCECDAIYMMRNYMRSRGAKLEFSVAAQMGKEIFYEEDCAC